MRIICKKVFKNLTCAAVVILNAIYSHLEFSEETI